MEMAYQLSFTPVDALLGGMLLGIAAASKLVMTGRVLGISGSVKGLTKGSVDVWRFMFLIGLLSSGGLWYVRDLPFSTDINFVSPFRSAVAGLLVGWGTARGNGCTSGHGICGNARLSKRSMLATITFMATGFITATATGTSSALDISNSPALYRVETPSESQLEVKGIAIGIATGTLLVILALTHFFFNTLHDSHHERLSAAMDAVSELLVGFAFGVGLLISGMVDPRKVSGFLTIGKSWDPTLMFVMVGALLVKACTYHCLTRRKKQIYPACRLEYSPPRQSKIDEKLVLGSAVFGVGWGLGGICPGPAIVFCAGHVHWLRPMIWLLMFVIGQWLHEGLLGAWIKKKLNSDGPITESMQGPSLPSENLIIKVAPTEVYNSCSGP